MPNAQHIVEECSHVGLPLVTEHYQGNYPLIQSHTRTHSQTHAHTHTHSRTLTNTHMHTHAHKPAKISNPTFPTTVTQPGHPEMEREAPSMHSTSLLTSSTQQRTRYNNGTKFEVLHIRP